MARNNPYGVNQYTPADIRQGEFLAAYINPASPTFGNVYQSCLVAGYEKSYALAITGQRPKWLYDYNELVADEKRRKRALKNLDKYLNLKTKVPVVTMVGILKDENGNVIEREDPALMDKQLKTTFFVAEKRIPEYAKVQRVESKHLHFSLSELAKLEKERNDQDRVNLAHSAQNEALQSPN